MRVGEIIADTEWMPGKDYGKDSPRVTVILPTFRRCQSGMFLNSAKSVLNQSLRDLELIIVDDASTDGTADQIKELMRADGRVSCLRHPRNIGLPAISEYEALKKARGEFLGFAFDDGTFLPEAIERLLQTLITLNTPIVHGYVTMHYHDPQTNETGHTYVGKGYVAQSTLLSHNYIPNNAVLMNKSLISEIGFYDPHVCMSRLCDWDLFQRVAEAYQFPDVDVCVGEEFGPLTNDSLGKTRLLDMYTVTEWMGAHRNSLLTPDSFEDYNVLALRDDLSERAKSVINEISKEFKDKFWHPKNTQITTNSAANRQIKKIPNNVSPSEDGRILVVCWCMDASVILYFKDLPAEYQSRIRLVLYALHQPIEMAGASALIFVRVLPKDDDPWIKLATKLGVPIYYYCDDNFCVLAEEGDRSLAEYTVNTLNKRLRQFSGILLSTSSLMDFFRDNKIHSNLKFYPPIKRQELGSKENKRQGSDFRVAFFGGLHRAGPFHKLVLPALQRLAESRSVEVILPVGSDPNPIPSQPGLNVIPVPRDISYSFVLRRFAELKPDVLVHPSSNTRNNKYKTVNCLINAAMMGSAAILSATDPFLETSKTNSAVLCEDSANSWYQALKQLAESPDRRDALRQAAVEYCETHYSGAENVKVIKSILDMSPMPGRCLTESRLLGCYRILQREYHEPGSGARGFARTSMYPVSVPALQEMKDLVAREDLPYQYDFTCGEESLSGVSFFVGTHSQQLNGVLQVRLYDHKRKHMLREASLNLAEIIDNGKVTATFPRLENTKGARLHMRLDATTSQRITLYCLPQKRKDKVTAAVNRLLRKPWKMFAVLHP